MLVIKVRKISKKCTYVFLSALCLISYSADASWKFKKEYGDTIIYISENGTRLTLRYGTTVPKKKKFSKTLIKDLEKEKKKLLSMIGVRHWKMDGSSVINKGRYTLVRLSGSYQDISNNLIYFVEYHFYSEGSRLQMLLTSQTKTLLKKDATLSKLRGFQTKYGF